jgi:hypothetical protein
MADIYYPLLLNSPEDSEEDDAEVRVHHIPKRYIRDALNPVEFTGTLNSNEGTDLARMLYYTEYYL